MDPDAPVLCLRERVNPYDLADQESAEFFRQARKRLEAKKAEANLKPN